MPKTKSGSRLSTSLDDVRELEEFFYALVPELARRKLRKGEDVSPIVKEMGLKVPACLRGSPITWPGALRPTEMEQGGTVTTLARPYAPSEGSGYGHFCLDIPITEPIGVIRICLECRFFLFCWITIRYIYPG